MMLKINQCVVRKYPYPIPHQEKNLGHNRLRRLYLAIYVKAKCALLLSITLSNATQFYSSRESLGC